METQNHTTTALSNEVKTYIRECFLKYGFPRFRTNPEMILHMLKKGPLYPGYDSRLKEVKQVLAEHGYANADFRGMLFVPLCWMHGEDGSKKVKYYRTEAGTLPIKRGYTLHARHWLDDQELEQLRKQLEN